MKLKTKFQDEDFDLGEVVEANIYHGGDGKFKVIAEPAKGGIVTLYFKTLKEMNEMFEDYEEPREYWHIFGTNITKTQEGLDEVYDKKNKEIGNWFETEGEVERAIEKMKAWTRLVGKGFRFDGWQKIKEFKYGNITFGIDDNTNEEDLDLLFGGGE